MRPCAVDQGAVLARPLAATSYEPGDRRHPMPELFIGGQWTAAANGQVREIRCPADGTLVATVDEGGPKDAAAAISAARLAFDDGPWPRTPAAERGRLVLRVADLLERDKDALARAESLDTGKRLVESAYDMDDIANCFRYFGNLGAVEAAATGWWTPAPRRPTAPCGTSRWASAR